MRVLLLVDMQNDFCPGGALAVPHGDETVAVANSLMRSGQFDLVVASLDYHPADHVSFADNHPGKNLFEEITISDAAGRESRQTLWPVHCVAGTPGADFHPELERNRIDQVVTKGLNSTIDSYSAFFDNGRQQETGLRTILQEAARARGETLRDIELAVCGLATDYCVAATARDARFLNIETTLLVDGCRAVNLNAGDDVRVLRELAQLGVRVDESRSILDRAVSIERTQSREQQIQPNI